MVFLRISDGQCHLDISSDILMTRAWKITNKGIINRSVFTSWQQQQNNLIFCQTNNLIVASLLPLAAMTAKMCQKRLANWSIATSVFIPFWIWIWSGTRINLYNWKRRFRSRYELGGKQNILAASRVERNSGEHTNSSKSSHVVLVKVYLFLWAFCKNNAIFICLFGWDFDVMNE